MCQSHCWLPATEPLWSPGQNMNKRSGNQVGSDLRSDYWPWGQELLSITGLLCVPHFYSSMWYNCGLKMFLCDMQRHVCMHLWNVLHSLSHTHTRSSPSLLWGLSLTCVSQPFTSTLPITTTPPTPNPDPNLNPAPAPKQGFTLKHAFEVLGTIRNTLASKNVHFAGKMRILVLGV